MIIIALIICEGMDNSGKSTLVAKLQLDLDAPIVKPPSWNRIFKLGKKAITVYADWLQLEHYQAKYIDIIMDRHPLISTFVYEPVLFNSNSLKTHPAYQTLKTVFQDSKPLIVYCRPSDETIRNFGERDQMAGVVDHAPALTCAYDLLMDRYRRDGFNVINYDWQSDSYLTLKLHLLNEIMLRSKV